MVGIFPILRGTVALVSFEPRREYQMDLLVKLTPIPCLILIGGVIITQHFFEPTSEPTKTKTKAIT